MIDHRLVAGDGITTAGLPPVAALAPEAAEPLEARVTRLEDAVAHLQDTQQLEEHVAERVTSRLKQELATATGITAHAPRRTSTAGAAPGTEANSTAHADDGIFMRFRRTWFIYEAYAEARTIIRMFFDRRYSLSWQCKIIPLVLLFFFLTSWFWIPFTSVLPAFIVWPINKTLEFLLAFLLIKFLTRETSRYRVFLAELSAASQ